MSGYALDAGVVSAIRASGLSPADWVGDHDVAVSEVAVQEVFRHLPADDAKYIGNLAVLAHLAEAPTVVTDVVIGMARELIARYSSHAPALATNDALIAADAILSSRVLITKNTHDFHHIDGLTWIDANGFHAVDGSLIQNRGAVRAGPGPRPCCSRL